MRLFRAFYKSDIHTLGGHYRFMPDAFRNRRFISGDIWIYQSAKSAL